MTGVKWIWAPACGSPAQFVSFTKTVLAPGDAVEGRLDFALGLGRNLPFRSGVFLVNGTAIARLTARRGKTAGFAIQYTGPLSPRALKAFTYGVNTLTIRADRSALPKGEPCNNLNRLIAAVASLDVRFRTDIVALGSQKGEKQITPASAGTSAAAIGDLEFRNAGPSGSTGGKLIFRWLATGPVQTAFAPSAFSAPAPFGDCTGGGEMTGTIECTYTDFPAGTVASINVRAVARALPEFTARSAGELEMDWQIIPDGGDRQATNNYASHTVMLCGAQTTDPRCKE
jgi:hypothetical protein